MISSYKKLLMFEEQYKNMDYNRLSLHEAIMKTLKELDIQLDSFKENINDRKEYWAYHAVASRNCIQIDDNELFLNLLLKLANNMEDKYDIKRIKVWELIPEVDDCYGIKVRWVDILADKEVLELFKDDEQLFNKDLIGRLNNITKCGYSFVMLSNLIHEYDGIDLKEKIATSVNKDIIVSVNNNDTLDICINKLVSYMKTNGSDFSNLNFNRLVGYISKLKGTDKKRVLTDNKYIKYGKK